MQRFKRALALPKFYEIYRKDLRAEPIPERVSSRTGEVFSVTFPGEVLWQTVSTFSQVLDYIFLDFKKEPGRFEYSFREVYV